MTDYDLVRSEIAADIGTPENRWDTRTNFDVDSAIRKGINSVVHNAMDHQFTWMRPIHRFSTADGQRRYTLPLDFEQFIDAIYFDGEEYQYPEITQLPASRLLHLHSEYDNTGTPTNYALEVENHDGTSQQFQTLVLHPTPDNTYKLLAPYQVGPIRGLSPERPWFPGGPENRELFVVSCLAHAEKEFMDAAKVNRQEEFNVALVAAIGRDHRRQPRNLGKLGGRGTPSRDWHRWKLSNTINGAAGY